MAEEEEDELAEGFGEEVDPEMGELEEVEEAEEGTVAEGEDEQISPDDQDEGETAPAARRKGGEEEDDDDDELDPDDIEADLDKILKERIAAADDEDEEEEAEQPAARTTGQPGSDVAPKKAHEFTCTGCFLLVNRAQFGPADALECPVGESDCPAISQILEDANA